MSENKQHGALGQAAGPITVTPTVARTSYPGHYVDCLCPAPLTVVAYIVANRARHNKLRSVTCQRLSRTSLPQRLLDYTIMEETPAVRRASASEPGFFCEHCGGAGVVPRSLLRDCHTWPTAQLCSACHALWHVMRAGVARL